MYPNKIIRVILFLIPFIFVSETCFSQNSSQSDSNKVDENSFGYLSIKTDLDSFYVAINDNFDNVYHITGNDTLSIPLGEHRIRLIKKNYRDLVTTLNIKPDTINVLSTNLLPFRNLKYHKYLSSYPRIFWGAPIIIKTDPDARLYVGEKFIGKGIGKIDTTGSFEVTSELPSGQIKTERYYIEKGRQTFFVKEIYHRPQKKKARYLAVLPGVSQVYQDDKFKGYLIMGATLIGTGLTVKYHNDFTNKYHEFKQTQQKYHFASDPSAAYELGNIAEVQLNEAQKIADIRDIIMYGAIGIYLYNAIDALLKPKSGFRKEIRIDPYVDFDTGYRKNLGISAKINF